MRERMWKEAIVMTFETLGGLYLEELWKTSKSICYGSQSLGLGLNMEPSE
jgi:hypothetical protein